MPCQSKLTSLRNQRSAKFNGNHFRSISKYVGCVFFIARFNVIFIFITELLFPVMLYTVDSLVAIYFILIRTFNRPFPT